MEELALVAQAKGAAGVRALLRGALPDRRFLSLLSTDTNGPGVGTNDPQTACKTPRSCWSSSRNRRQSRILELQSAQKAKRAASGGSGCSSGRCARSASGGARLRAPRGRRGRLRRSTGWRGRSWALQSCNPIRTACAWRWRGRWLTGELQVFRLKPGGARLVGREVSHGASLARSESSRFIESLSPCRRWHRTTKTMG